MAILINRTGEHSPDVARAEIFSKMKKCVSAHRLRAQWIVDWISHKKKNQIKSNFSTNLWPSRKKIKEDLSWSDLRREDYKRRDSFEVQTESNAHSDARTSTLTPQHSTSYKLVLTFLWLLMEAPWPENHDPTQTLLQRRRSPSPIEINFGWPRKSVTHPNNTNIGTFFISWFHHHSTRVKFSKVSSI